MSFKSRACVFILSLVLIFSFVTPPLDISAQMSVSAHSAILMDADSGMVMLEKNAHNRMGMASTTKIMTALTVLRLCDVSKTVSIPREAIQTEGSSVYLCEGEQMTIEQLLYALLLASANDAAVALAVTVCGSVERFADQMNAYAEELGLSDTHFTNPHGLAEDDHYTTAYDLAIISKKALESELLRGIFSTYKHEIPFNGEPNKRLVVNHNKLLRSYDGAIGIKTGFTKSTGRCLVSAAEREGLTLICVTLNAPDDWRDHSSMLNYGFENYTRCVFANAGEFFYSVPVTGADCESVTLTNAKPLALTIRKGDEENVACTVYSSYRFVYASVNKGTVYASVSFEYKGAYAVS
ncbi:MAG: D-alanyl-D-alanine carboxypeptidase, partial [Clostridia bacterium]|nr:D-alanyl-D-alanine carboxypeptidase [Clostridia bacterium]